MAHIGKSYKLWFRRDFSLGQPNARGFAEAYDSPQNYFGGTDGSAFPATSRRLINTQEQAGDTRQWTSDVFIVHGKHYTVQLSIDNDINFGAQTFQLNVQSTEDGVQFRQQMNTPGFPWYQYDFWNLQPFPPLIQTARVKVGPGQTVYGLVAATWSTYNP